MIAYFILIRRYFSFKFISSVECITFYEGLMLSSVISYDQINQSYNI